MDRAGQRLQLAEDGYTLLPNILSSEMLERARQVSNEVLEAQDRDHFERQRSTGSLIGVQTHPWFAELVAWTPALQALEDLGFADPRFTSGFVISKPPHSPPLFWHQDWYGWNEPCSYTEPTLQVFLMYYLVDTTPDNGCLRVLRGSHRRRHEMHDLVPEAHTETLHRATDPDHPAFHPIPEDTAVPVRAGDLVVGDARLLHGAYANNSDHRRTVLTLWFHRWDRYSEPLRAHMASEGNMVSQWPPEAQARIEGLIPDYTGDAEPIVRNRVPGPDFR